MITVKRTIILIAIFIVPVFSCPQVLEFSIGYPSVDSNYIIGAMGGIFPERFKIGSERNLADFLQNLRASQEHRIGRNELFLTKDFKETNELTYFATSFRTTFAISVYFDSRENPKRLLRFILITTSMLNLYPLTSIVTSY